MRQLYKLLILAIITDCRSLPPISRPDYQSNGKDFQVEPLDIEQIKEIHDIPDTKEITKEEGVGVFDTEAKEEEVLEVLDTQITDIGEVKKRDCSITFSFKPSQVVQSVTVPGEWNSWNVKAHPMTESGGEWSVTIDASEIPPGEWGYKFLINQTEWIQDPSNPLVKWDEGYKNENSKLIVPDCTLPLLELDSVNADFEKKSITVQVKVYAGIDGSPINAITVSVNGKPLKEVTFDSNSQTILVSLSNLKKGKYAFLFKASVNKGDASLWVPVWLEEKPFSWQDAILYFAMTDRFYNGDKSNDKKAEGPECSQLPEKVNWMGGDWKGIQMKIEEGYFDKLGVNAIWISAGNDNPDGCYKGSLGYLYSAYHGYFPITLDTTENHFGTMEDLKSMVQAAHERGIRVIMDLDANHVFQTSNIWAAHKEWFNQTPIMCGDDDNWNQHPIDCWFEPYLPDLDFRNNDAVNAFTDAAIWWAQEANLDGFRVDAVKHMVHNFTRTLRYKVEKKLETSQVRFILIGETFVGDWGGGTGKDEQKVKEYISKWELTGQFNFPLYWQIVRMFAYKNKGGGGMLGGMLEQSQNYWGDGAIMSNFLGNHDVARFISHASGDIADEWSNGAKEAGWSNPPKLPDSQEPFLRLKAAFGFLMTISGIPLIYYGDEIGMPGAGDPDNRRMMQFENLTPLQESVKGWVGKLTSIRFKHPSTRQGQFQTLWSDINGIAYAMKTSDDFIIGIFNRGGEREITIDVSKVTSASQLKDQIDGKNIPVNQGKITLKVPSLGFIVLALP